MLSIRVDHYHHFPRDPAADQVLAALADLKATTITIVQQQGGQIMGVIDTLRADLQEANATTNQIAATLVEIGSDIDDLLARVPDVPADVAAEATALKVKLAETAAALRTVADKHTPGGVPPPVDPPPTEDPPPPVG